MTDLPRLIGGPSDGIVLPKRYANAFTIQMPVTGGKWNFATYIKNPENPSQFLFKGFIE